MCWAVNDIIFSTHAHPKTHRQAMQDKIGKLRNYIVKIHFNEF